jgi:hypothetical protein
MVQHRSGELCTDAAIGTYSGFMLHVNSPLP